MTADQGPNPGAADFVMTRSGSPAYPFSDKLQRSIDTIIRLRGEERQRLGNGLHALLEMKEGLEPSQLIPSFGQIFPDQDMPPTLADEPKV